MDTNKEKTKQIGIILMIAVTVLLLPILLCNLTLIIKGSLSPERPPDLFGVAPLAVTSGSMEGKKADSFNEGALIFVKILDKKGIQKLQEGDVITFLSSDAYVTHRIVAVNRTKDGEVISFITQGDANAVTDGAIPIKNVIGKLVGSVNGLGSFAMFMKTPVGILVFVGIPVLIFIVYDVLRIVIYNKRIKSDNRKEIQEKEEEIERLRALVEKQNGDSDSKTQD